MAPQQKSLRLLEKQGRIVVQEVDIPKPEPGELLVEIHAAALNPADWKVALNGLFFQKFPAALGVDAAGIVKEVGKGVTKFVVGDRV